MSWSVLLWVAGRDVLNRSINSWIDEAGFGLSAASTLTGDKEAVLTASDKDAVSKRAERTQKLRNDGKKCFGIIPTAEMTESLENSGWLMRDDPIASAKTWQESAMVLPQPPLAQSGGPIKRVWKIKPPTHPASRRSQAKGRWVAVRPELAKADSCAVEKFTSILAEKAEKMLGSCGKATAPLGND